jgi:hypothetical protein
MAIEDNTQARIGGTVTYKNDKGTLFKMESLLPGNQYPERTTVWGLAERVNVGDRVLVSGVITSRKGKYMKQDVEILTVEVSLNKPEIIEIESAGAPAEPDSWGAVAPAGVPDDDRPF